MKVGKKREICSSCLVDKMKIGEAVFTLSYNDKNVHVAGEDEQVEEKSESAGENGLNASDVYILPSDVYIFGENVDISKQSKVKESKLKVEERKTPPSNPPRGEVAECGGDFFFHPPERGKTELRETGGEPVPLILILKHICNINEIRRIYSFHIFAAVKQRKSH
jgi:hypothetical protein